LTYEALAARWGLVVCDSHVGCKRRWPTYRHVRGAVDQYGYLHWSPIHSRMTRAGLRNFLKLVAWNRLTADAKAQRAFDRRPLWWKLWRLNVEAYRIARNELHVNLRAEDSYDDRNRARWLSRYARTRVAYPAAYEWMYWPFRKADDRRRRDEQPDTTAA
jgi:hypothetical protein